MRNYRGELLNYGFEKEYLTSKEKTKLIKEISEKRYAYFENQLRNKSIDYLVGFQKGVRERKDIDEMEKDYLCKLINYKLEQKKSRRGGMNKIIKEIPEKRNALEIKLEKETRNIDEKIKKLNKEDKEILRKEVINNVYDRDWCKEKNIDYVNPDFILVSRETYKDLFGEKHE